MPGDSQLDGKPLHQPVGPDLLRVTSGAVLSLAVPNFCLPRSFPLLAAWSCSHSPTGRPTSEPGDLSETPGLVQLSECTSPRPPYQRQQGRSCEAVWRLSLTCVTDGPGPLQCSLFFLTARNRKERWRQEGRRWRRGTWRKGEKPSIHQCRTCFHENLTCHDYLVFVFLISSLRQGLAL